MANKEIICRECKNTFLFSKEEQEFYAGLNFKDPSKCKPCRNAKHQETFKEAVCYE